MLTEFEIREAVESTIKQRYTTKIKIKAIFPDANQQELAEIQDRLSDLEITVFPEDPSEDELRLLAEEQEISEDVILAAEMLCAPENSRLTDPIRMIWDQEEYVYSHLSNGRVEVFKEPIVSTTSCLEKPREARAIVEATVKTFEGEFTVINNLSSHKNIMEELGNPIKSVSTPIEQMKPGTVEGSACRDHLPLETAVKPILFGIFGGVKATRKPQGSFRIQETVETTDDMEAQDDVHETKVALKTW